LHADFIEQIFECHARERLPLQVAVQLALVGRFYERIGDHAVNIARRVLYMVTGWMPGHVATVRHRSQYLSEEAEGDGTGPDEAQASG
jgi:phosphate transport system protein